MSRSRRSVRHLLVAGSVLFAARTASATTYTDAIGDVPGGQNAATDLASVTVTNDSTNVYFLVNLNPAANITTFPYVQYHFGIQTSAGGLTTAPDPYGGPILISTGMTDFIGTEFYANGAAVSQGFLYNWQPSSSSMVLALPGGLTPVTVTQDSVSSFTMSVPLAQLGTDDATSTPTGLTGGQSFNFDVWTTFSPTGSNSAYDALDNPNPTPGYVGSTGVTYDSATATGSTFSTTIYTIVLPTYNGTWFIDGGGSWNDPNSWTPSNSVPNGPASTATFGSVVDSADAPAIVTLSTSQTVGQITFNNSNQYQITAASGAPSGTGLDINDAGDSNGFSPSISVLAGSHIIAVPLYLAAGVTLSASANSSLTISGNISNATGGAGPVTVAGAGSVTLSGTNSYSGNTTVNSGATLNVVSASSMALALPSTTTLISNGTTTFAANPGSGFLAQTLAGITLGSSGKIVVANPIGGQSNRTVLATGSLTINAGGMLDLSANDMIVQSGVNGETVLPTIASEIALGRGANGLWTGNGITSSAAASSPATMALGVILNDTNASNLNPTTRAMLSGTGIMSTFDGQPVNDGDVLVKYTYVGDADLSGTVTAADYLQIDNAFSYNNANPSTPMTGWYNGDFNYDGVINGDDYTLIDNAFNTQGASLAAVPAEPAEMIASATNSIAAVAVPEPAALGLVGISAAQMLLRRRRRT